MTLTEFLNKLEIVSTSIYALVGYVILIAGWIITIRIKSEPKRKVVEILKLYKNDRERNEALTKLLKKEPPNNLKKDEVIKWVKSESKIKSRRYLLIGFISTLICTVLLVISFISSEFNNDKSNLKSQPQNFVNSRVDTGNITNNTAERDINIDNKTINNFYKDTPESRSNNKINKPEIRPKVKNNITAGDNNIIIQGDNNTVNKYGSDMPKPRIILTDKVRYVGKAKLPSPLTEDSLFKYSLSFDYQNQLRADKMLICFINSPEIKYINFRYTAPGGHLIERQAYSKNGYRGTIINNPKNGEIEVEIYSMLKRDDFQEKLFVIVDTARIY